VIWPIGSEASRLLLVLEEMSAEKVLTHFEEILLFDLERLLLVEGIDALMV